MIDRHIPHAEILRLKGGSYRPNRQVYYLSPGTVPLFSTGFHRYATSRRTWRLETEVPPLAV
jgi:hypothetical protein